ncbi:dipeptide ABC transporter ATP-binding protein [Paradevosia shaoguanensis]|uniref:dipeptide ABC transporter ATP-binding protein n=1 Tax=Paradevosia shaoguanensis TaxID=1335043 RepID=UPI0019329BDD|nr:ABC transporter ATP-binding protein [Paradevosia shaoguanensis]
MPPLELRNLSVAFGENTVLSGVSYALEQSERFGIIGESGSGKTMMSLAITGLLPEGAQRGGEIVFDGTPLPRDERGMARLRGSRIAMVFQEPMTALNPLMRVGAQIAEAGSLAGTNPGVESLLREVGLDPLHAARYPHELSGGQRQRVMIAIALAGEPDLLIADEPTSALDLITQRRILDLIAEVCDRRGMALLFISHDLKAVAALCQRVLVLRRGEVVEQGRAADVFGAPSADYTRTLIAAAKPRIRAVPPPSEQKPLLEVQNLARHFRQPGRAWFLPGAPFAAVDGVSFSLAQSESVAIVGPSGCGKTTLARIIAGLDRADGGRMVFHGSTSSSPFPPHPRTSPAEEPGPTDRSTRVENGNGPRIKSGEVPWWGGNGGQTTTASRDATTYHGSDLPRRLRRDISLVFQDPYGSFDPRLEVGRAVAEPLRLEPGITPAERLKRVAEAVEAVGLSPTLLNRYPHEFSGGQRQRLAIARALVTRPRLVILDEPVSALDVSLRGDVLALLNRLRGEYGLAYLVISHDLDMVRSVSDRVLVMEKGQIVEEGRPADIFEHPQHRLTRELLAARLPDVA